MSNKNLPGWLAAARAQWRFRGQERPAFAVEPEPGQTSVWDFPRPPAIAPESREVVVLTGDKELARSVRSLKVMETASPPTFYVPLTDVDRSMLVEVGGGSFCEWKGQARYYSVNTDGEMINNAVWQYPEPLPGFEQIADYVAFYPGMLDCTLGGETVLPQPGGLYGGWVTKDLAGPFKGEPGTGAW